MSLLIFCLFLSVGINALLIWYIRKMLQKLLFVSDSIGSLLVSEEQFSNHLSSLHDLETYYGDETLGGLIRHSKQVVEDIRQFEDIYTLTNENLQNEESE